MARYDPASGWADTTQITPFQESGTLAPITDLKVLEVQPGGANDEELVVFANSQGISTARRLNLTTLQWDTPSSPVHPTAGSSFEIFRPLRSTDYTVRSGSSNNLPYGSRIRSRIGTMTPKATASVDNEFLVQWTNLSPAPGSSGVIFVAIYNPSASPAWGPAIDLSSVANLPSNSDDLARAGVRVAVDDNAWATLLFLEEEPGSEVNGPVVGATVSCFQ